MAWASFFFFMGLMNMYEVAGLVFFHYLFSHSMCYGFRWADFLMGDLRLSHSRGVCGLIGCVLIF